MNDSIYRQAAIDALNSLQKFSLIDSNECLHGVGVRLKFAVQALEQLPSAQPDRRWIPCSKRLPKVSGRYLVSEHSPLGEFTCTRYWNQGDRRGYWSGDGYSTVTAWMPLPEPYVGEIDTERRTDV